MFGRSDVRIYVRLKGVAYVLQLVWKLTHTCVCPCDKFDTSVIVPLEGLAHLFLYVWKIWHTQFCISRRFSFCFCSYEEFNTRAFVRLEGLARFCTSRSFSTRTSVRLEGLAHTFVPLEGLTRLYTVFVSFESQVQPALLVWKTHHIRLPERFAASPSCVHGSTAYAASNSSGVGGPKPNMDVKYVSNQ